MKTTGNNGLKLIQTQAMEFVLKHVWKAGVGLEGIDTILIALGFCGLHALV